MNIIKLEHNVCKNYLYKVINGWGPFSTAIVEKDLLKTGSYYSLGARHVDKDRLYDFDSPQSDPPDLMVVIKPLMTPIVQAAEKVVLKYIYKTLQKKIFRIFVLEEYYAKPDDPWVQRENPDYKLVGEKMIYSLTRQSTPENIEYFYKTASNIPFMFFALSEKDLEKNGIDDLLSYNNNQQIENISCLFLEIYDQEGFMMWISDKQPEALTLIKELIENEQS